MHRLLLLTVALLAACCSPTVHDGPALIEAQHPLPGGWDAEVFETALRALEEECPLNAPAMVSVGPIPGALWGLTWWDEGLGVYVIMIDGRQPMHAIVSTLEHEWAHAMVWDATQRPEDDGHGPLWGVAQARCYRAVLAALSALGEARAAEAGDEAPEEPEPVEERWEAPVGKVPRCSHHTR